jgi:tetratricopeptide (TPR) repeat protein
MLAKKSHQLSFALLGLSMLFSQVLSAQCETWVGAANEEEAKEHHVVYRQFLKSEDYTKAFEFWQLAYSLAPAADGQRASHYIDGRTLYMNLFNTETDEEKKKEYAATILRLYDEEIECYQNEAFLLGRKAYDMYYTLRSNYSDLITVLEKAIEVGGNDSEYIVLEPFANIVVYEYQGGRMDADKARQVHESLYAIAEYNVENNETYGEYFEASKQRMDAAFAPIVFEIFDCAYFKGKFEPLFRENPEDFEKTKYYYNVMVQQGCAEDDPLVVEMRTKYEEVVAEINAAIQDSLFQIYPEQKARWCYENEDYGCAVEQYRMAIEKETAKGDEADKEKLGEWNFSIASILFRKQKKYSSARDYARRAAKLRPNWGQPYMLIGDMYASSSSSCGTDAWEKQIAVLAAIDKYAYAKSIDSSVASDANSKIARYSEYKPEKQEGFMRGIKEGQTVTVGCWIGESVRVRFK